MASSSIKYEQMFARFLQFAKDSQERYPELILILDPLTKVNRLSVFLLFYRSAPESQVLLDICRNSDEGYQTENVDRIIGDMLVQHQLDPAKFDARDRAKLCKYLRVFSDLALNGIE